MKQTAVDYLHERYMYVTWQRNIGLISEKQEDKYRVYYLAEAKEMEKEQMRECYENVFFTDSGSELKFEEYYNETYEKK